MLYVNLTIYTKTFQAFVCSSLRISKLWDRQKTTSPICKYLAVFKHSDLCIPRERLCRLVFVISREQQEIPSCILALLLNQNGGVKTRFEGRCYVRIYPPTKCEHVFLGRAITVASGQETKRNLSLMALMEDNLRYSRKRYDNFGNDGNRYTLL